MNLKYNEKSYVSILQYDDNPTLCWFYDDSPTPSWVDLKAGNDPGLDCLSDSYFVVNADSTDALYIGKATKFAMLGMRVQRAGVYSTVTVQYSSSVDVNNNVDGWTTLTIVFDSTAKAKQDGFIAWNITGLTGWLSGKVNSSAAAYWIRIVTDSTGTPAILYNLLLNVLVKPPVVVDPEHYFPSQLTPGWDRDINMQLTKLDVPYFGPTKLALQCALPSLTLPDVTLLSYWKKNRNKVTIQDHSYTATIGSNSFNTDAFYRNYRGIVFTVPGNLTSPYKQDVDKYNLEFLIEYVDDIPSRIGL